MSCSSQSLVAMWVDCYVGGLPFKSSILPLLKHACGEQQVAAMLAVKRSAGVTPEVNLREHVSCTPLSSANKAAHSSFETQSPKQGCQWLHKRTCVHQILF